MILIAYDSSEDAVAAIEAAGRLMSGQPALVLTVWEPFTMILSRTPASMGSIGGYGDISHIDAASRVGAQRQAEEGARLAREHGLDATGRTVARVGSIAEAILSESDRIDADLIVVGNVRLGEPHEWDGCRATRAREDRDQSWPVARPRPLMQCRGWNVEVGRALAQRE
jgi:nucleotide-binding universal stress UspA family protein